MVADTVKFVQEKVPISMASTEFLLKQAVENVLDILKHPNKLDIPTIVYGNKVKNAFTQVAHLLDKERTQAAKTVVPEKIPSEQRVPMPCPSGASGRTLP